MALFTYSCNGLSCDFDASGSSDPDGSIVSYDWDFGDGNSGGGLTADHTYAAAGTYSVVLTVTDDEEATGTDSQDVTVNSIVTNTLTATGYKERGVKKADLAWSDVTFTYVTIYRNGSLITTTANIGSYTDIIGRGGGSSYTYKVCKEDTNICSNKATVNF